MRLQKYMSQSGIASRREAERWIQSGWVRLNGEVVLELGTQMDPEVDVLTVVKPDSEPQFERQIIVFHKPVGIVTNCPQGDETEIADLLPPEYQRFNAIGRLDKASEGLILLTNDGLVSQRLLDPKFPHERVYEVSLDYALPEKTRDELESGVYLFGERTKPLKIKYLASDVVEMRMHEGKNRQIRRMMQKVGIGVLKLKRLSFGPIHLGNLEVGGMRLLSNPEMADLLG